MADEQTEPAKATKSKKAKLMPLIIVGAMMAAEGVGVFMLAGAISPPPEATLAAQIEEEKENEVDTDAFAEVELAECRPSNMMSGAFITFDIRVSALVSSADLERVEGLARTKRARLEDGVNIVLRSAEPRELNEPGLETLKRRLKREFDEIFGDDQMVKKVLIPRFLQSNRGV